ncbi:MAG: Gfo/Idh/MocA family oxidoreductase [Polyangiaceae bacterium]|nr:Gfo/Idh/MocA family oxidoreductase [Polyangiaceae bacterium]
MHTGELKLCVIGLGNMGRNHVRALASDARAALVGVSDPSLDARERCPLPRGARVYDDWRRMLDRERPDGVVVAVPADRHVEVAKAALARGAHALVEKPIATTEAGARELMAAATEHRRRLMVGHIERFNPAVRELARQLAGGDAGRIVQLEARRHSPYRARVDHVGVAIDLATHDLELMHFLTGARVTRAHAETRRVSADTREDMMCGLLRFETGAIGLLDVSWMAPAKRRELSVVTERARFDVDYLAQTLVVGRGDHVRRVDVERAEPLRGELDAFLDCVEHDAPPLVGAAEGLEALRVAIALAESGRAGEAG